MIKNFTTPAFAKGLKEHGIEIDTQFYWENNGNGLRLMAIACDSPYIICIGEFDPTLYGSFVGKPAYPLTEVLGWLPKTLIEHLKPTNIPSHRPDYLSYPMVSDIDEGNVLKIGYKSEYYGTKITPMPIEALIIQGLTEGWLTKDNLNIAK
jgi:hypothetical protein